MFLTLPWLGGPVQQLQAAMGMGGAAGSLPGSGGLNQWGVSRRCTRCATAAKMHGPYSSSWQTALGNGIAQTDGPVRLSQKE